jgi:hypothetical protein
MNFGISPVIVLQERSKETILSRCVKILGSLVILQHASPSSSSPNRGVDTEILPSSTITENLLCERFKTVSFLNLQKDERYTEPTKLFNSIFRQVKFVSCKNDSGNCPVNPLPLNTTVIREEYAESNSSIGPESWFLSRNKKRSAGRAKRDAGISPAGRAENIVR